ncbi:MAG TPA: PspC domain-containing protein [Candidatus Limnocylindria bacterium]|jgi:phage shock protein C|nr:PspC domain-containing protein [Candidatus Limnocylindria bacterium]
MEDTSTAPRLYRSATDKVIAGVCGGLARYFALDPALVRLVFVVFAFAGGASILMYVVLWIAVPVGTGGPAVELGDRGQEMLATILIAVGALWLLANVGAFAFINWRLAWPIVLIVAGAALLLRRVRP